ncbi:hypothetical protein [Methanothrix soehngenii]|uniref:hypothetical protein n=1 Tax=Methanothrix soehngenii TaxID=2223 RepID=UPI00300D8EA1
MAKLKQNIESYYFINPNSVFQLSNGTWHMQFVGLSREAMTEIASGDRFALPLRSQSLLIVQQLTNFNLSNVVVYAGPGLASAWVRNSGSIVINDFQVRRKEGTNRLMSSGADAIHMVDNLASTAIANCFFEGMGDDALNTRSTAFKIEDKSSSSQIFFKTLGLSLFSVGQSVQVVDPMTQLAKGTSKILSLTVAPDGSAIIGLDHPIASLKPGDLFFVAEFAIPNLLLTNNVFSNFRGTLRIRSSGAMVLNNHFVDPRNSSIFVSADIQSAWQEGPSLIPSPENSLSGIYFYENLVDNGSMRLSSTTNYGGAPPLSGKSSLLTHPLIFDVKFYRLNNSDLAAMNDSQLATHWVDHGVSEGRGPLSDIARLNIWKYIQT